MKFLQRFYLWLVVFGALGLVFTGAAFAQDSEPVENAEDLAAWASITGILLPLVIAVILRHGWTAQVKMIVAAVIAVVDAVVVTGLTHGWHFDGHLMATVAAVLALSQTTYRNIWLKLGDNSTPPGEPGPDAPTDPPLITKLEKATG
jgi:L-lactate permease